MSPDLVLVTYYDDFNTCLFFYPQFPYCDGSHNAHNRETGDNVGPLIVKRKAA